MQEVFMSDAFLRFAGKSIAPEGGSYKGTAVYGRTFPAGLGKSIAAEACSYEGDGRLRAAQFSAMV